MSKGKKIIRNIGIILILLYMSIVSMGLYFDPMKAHESSERSIHYGPSKVVHVEDLPDRKLILGKYDKWVSCNTVNKSMYFLWRIGSQAIGFENKKEDPIEIGLGSSGDFNRVYGIRNDKDIAKIVLTLGNGEEYTQTEFYEDVFLILYKEYEGQERIFSRIDTYDSKDNLIYSKTR